MAELRAHLAVPRFVEHAGRAELTGLHSQPVDFLRYETGALIGRWQQTDVTEGQHWQVRGQLAELEFGLRQLGLERRANASEVICRVAITAGRKQAGVDPTSAAVELEA